MSKANKAVTNVKGKANVILDRLGEKYLKVHELSQDPTISNKEIAKKLGISVVRIYQMKSKITKELNRKKKWTDGLSTRSKNILDIAEIKNKTELKKLVESGDFHYKSDKFPSMGKASYTEIINWSGIQPIVPVESNTSPSTLLAAKKLLEDNSYRVTRKR